MSKPQPPSTSNFIKQGIEADLASGKHTTVVTRFPPEPNGYLHFGHAKSIVLNFELAKLYGGRCNLRFDDTNPEKEEQEYVDSIKEGVKWLGFDWGDTELYASDYFDKLYEFAEALINAGLAYVDSQSAEQISASRGTLSSGPPGLLRSSMSSPGVAWPAAVATGWPSDSWANGSSAARRRSPSRS